MARPTKCWVCFRWHDNINSYHPNWVFGTVRRHYSRPHRNTGTNQVHPWRTMAYGPPATEASSSRSPQPASSAVTCPPQRAPRHPLYSGISEDTTDFLRASSDLLSRTQIFPSNYRPPTPNTSSWMTHKPKNAALLRSRLHVGIWSTPQHIQESK